MALEKGRLVELAEKECQTFGIDRAIFFALIEQESSWRQGAWNPEPAYRYLWDTRAGRPFRKLTEAESASEVPPVDFYAPPNVPRDSEWWGQQSSWGLCQVMGAVAREHLFNGEFFTDLCIFPELGLNYGVRHLRKMLDSYKGSMPHALAAYNGGPGAANQDPFPNFHSYVRPILRMAEVNQ